MKLLRSPIGTAADTEVNDETDGEAEGDEDGGQSEIVVPQPPYIGQRFESFEEAKEFYQTYASSMDLWSTPNTIGKLRKLTSTAEVR